MFPFLLKNTEIPQKEEEIASTCGTLMEEMITKSTKSGNVC